MKFQVLVCDPPWAFGDRLQKMKAPTKRSAASQYSTMSAQEISRLDVPSLVDPNGCVLALWVPSTLLEDGLYVMKSWGFQLKTTVCWVKQSKQGKLGFGMGRLFRASHEIALICSIGKPLGSLCDHSQRSTFLAPNEGHSIKPDNLHISFELMFPSANKLELFARRIRPTWTCVGDAVTGNDIMVDITNLQNV